MAAITVPTATAIPITAATTAVTIRSAGTGTTITRVPASSSTTATITAITGAAISRTTGPLVEAIGKATRGRAGTTTIGAACIVQGATPPRLAAGTGIIP